jgi:hypothetical protein
MKTTREREVSTTSTASVPDDIHARILRLLSMTRRPLESTELTQALALGSEAKRAFHWLNRNGYIQQSDAARATAEQIAIGSWLLADRGREWAEGHGAL